MASTSMTLGEHWEGFIQEQVKSGRYASTSEVVRAALRELEAKSASLGAEQAKSGEFVSDWTPADAVARAVARRE